MEGCGEGILLGCRTMSGRPRPMGREGMRLESRLLGGMRCDM